MFKLIKIQNESWWIPESNPIKLAVQITDEDSYHMEMIYKLETLIEEAGLEQATATARMTLEEAEARAMETPQSVEHLARILMDRTDIGEKVRQGRPDRTEAVSDLAEAEEAVREQAHLTLEDFLN
jgi:hypothetical protein